jgi:hypothetical protein
MTDRLAEDMERLLGWRLEYVLAYPKTREWLKLLRTAGLNDLPHVARAIAADSDEAPEALLFKKLLEKLLEARAETA